jgi:uncharacterized protein
MPEYLSPGVYIEETSFRSKTIEGVSTSTAGFVGPARYGPVSGPPVLVTSLADYQRIFGDLDDLNFTNQANTQVNYLAHAVRAFFEEGGRRLFISRVFNAPRAAGFDIDDGIPGHHYALTDTLAATLAPALQDAAQNALAGAISASAAVTTAAAAAAQAAVDAAQASSDAVVAAGAPAGTQTAAADALTAAQDAQTAVNDAQTAIADLDGAADVLAAIGDAQTAVDDAVQAAADALTAAQAAETAINAEGDEELDELAAEAVEAADDLVQALAGLPAHVPALAGRAATASVLTDLEAGTNIAAAEVTETDTQLTAARTNLATAQADLAAAQAALDADPTNQALARALGVAATVVDAARGALAAAQAAWIAANTAVQIEDLQPGAGDEPLHLVARFPGAAGNMRVNFTLRPGANAYLARAALPNPGLNRLRDGALVHVRTRATAGDPWALPAGNEADPDGLMIANYDQPADLWTLNGVDAGGGPTDIVLDGAFRAALGTAQFEVRPLSIVVSVERPTGEVNVFEREETLGEFALEPERRTSLLRTFTANPESGFAALTTPFAVVLPSAIDEPTALDIARHLMAPGGLLGLLIGRSGVELRYTLAGGDDGDLPLAPAYTGDPDFDDLTGDVLNMPLNGLLAFESQEDISIVAAPGYTADRDTDGAMGVQNAVINHCERMRYRVAVLETPENQTTTEALDFRNQRSSDYAAMYYPWINVIDPRPSQGGQLLKLPPSGFMAGIYARNDIEHAVFKAPANEVVRLAVDFEVKVNGAQQDILNPNGLNCLRFFEGRGYLVWGARTISDDPEWKYISVRRYFAYLERSIDRSTQWAVFENNGPELWGKIRRSVEDFLYNEWVAGGLLGAKPEQAYFVRCDRSTMTQNDLDNGRLVCLIGVAPVKPAEFVIFRIGQWTADAQN